MNASNSVVNGPENSQNIYGKNYQPNKNYCRAFQKNECFRGKNCHYTHEKDPSENGGYSNYKDWQQSERGRKRDRSTSRSTPTGFHRTTPEEMKTSPGMTRDKPLKQSTSLSSISISPTRKPLASILKQRQTTPSSRQIRM